jgi:hypothetical protein
MNGVRSPTQLVGHSLDNLRDRIDGRMEQSAAAGRRGGSVRPAGSAVLLELARSHSCSRRHGAGECFGDDSLVAIPSIGRPLHRDSDRRLAPGSRPGRYPRRHGSRAGPHRGTLS